MKGAEMKRFYFVGGPLSGCECNVKDAFDEDSSYSFEYDKDKKCGAVILRHATARRKVLGHNINTETRWIYREEAGQMVCFRIEYATYAPAEILGVNV